MIVYACACLHVSTNVPSGRELEGELVRRRKQPDRWRPMIVTDSFVHQRSVRTRGVLEQHNPQHDADTFCAERQRDQRERRCE